MRGYAYLDWVEQGLSDSWTGWQVSLLLCTDASKMGAFEFDCGLVHLRD